MAAIIATTTTTSSSGGRDVGGPVPTSGPNPEHGKLSWHMFDQISGSQRCESPAGQCRRERRSCGASSAHSLFVGKPAGMWTTPGRVPLTYEISEGKIEDRIANSRTLDGAYQAQYNGNSGPIEGRASSIYRSPRVKCANEKGL